MNRERIGVQALFVHEPLLFELADPERTGKFESELARRSRFMGDKAARAGVLGEAVIAPLLDGSDAVGELDVLYIGGELRAGQLVQLTQTLYFRRVDEDNGLFHGKLDVDDAVRVRGRFSRMRTVSVTGDHELSGRTNVTMLAYVQELPGKQPDLVVRPLFIGWRVREMVPGLGMARVDPSEVFVSQIDQLSAARGVRTTKAMLEAVAGLAEKDIKNAFADIVGEHYVTKDWGGEGSDLLTAHLTVEGRPLTTAFAFKGPGLRGDLTIARMGKNGDQGVRLANEPADLLVVQHYRRIAPEVRALMRALARSSGKSFAIFDGAVTAAVLKAYGKLPR